MRFKYILVLSLVVLITSCTSSPEKSAVANDTQVYIEGEAQGTTYHIKYLDSTNTNYKASIDSILKVIDQSVSTYLPTSLISELNTSKDTVVLDPIFKAVYLKSMEVSASTSNAFDVTLAPVINAYGWGFKNKATITPSLIDSLLALSGKDKFKFIGDTLIKTTKGAMLDFNAIAQGYSTDLIAAFLDQMQLDNYMVELGGEVITKGTNSEGEFWRLGVDKPEENAKQRKLTAILSLEDEALATSGNYRKFYEENGTKYSHTIDPKTGYPVKHSLLSASVVASTGMEADAYATAFMVVGLEKSKEILSNNAGLEALLIYADSSGNYKTYLTKGLEKKITMVND